MKLERPRRIVHGRNIRLPNVSLLYILGTILEKSPISWFVQFYVPLWGLSFSFTEPEYEFSVPPDPMNKLSIGWPL